MERGWRPLLSGGVRAKLALDGALALVVGALAVQGSWSSAAERGIALDGHAYALVVIAAAALVVRRVWPLLALGVSFVATLGYLLLGLPYSPIVQLVAVAMYSVAAWRPRWSSGLALAVVAAIYAPLAWWKLGAPAPWLDVLPAVVLWLVLPWLAGVGMRAYRSLRAQAAEAERQSHLMEERLRIAREVHDVVGHSLAVINLQAGVALHVLPRRPDRAEEALRAMRDTSAQALAELRVALADGDPPERRLTVGLSRLPDLVESLRHTGLRVELEIVGKRTVICAATDVAAYRIVQESLTNVVRHAAAGSAKVKVDYTGTGVRVTVSDDGRGARRPKGRGLVGMEERAMAVGGHLEAGPGPDGGFRVTATLPAGAR